MCPEKQQKPVQAGVGLSLALSPSLSLREWPCHSFFSTGFLQSVCICPLLPQHTDPPGRNPHQLGNHSVLRLALNPTQPHQSGPSLHSLAMIPLQEDVSRGKHLKTRSLLPKSCEGTMAMLTKQGCRRTLDHDHVQVMQLRSQSILAF